jgi:hypothetical protein
MQTFADLAKALMTPDQINAAVRINWCHFTPEVDWQSLADRISVCWHFSGGRF